VPKSALRVSQPAADLDHIADRTSAKPLNVPRMRSQDARSPRGKPGTPKRIRGTSPARVGDRVESFSPFHSPFVTIENERSARRSLDS
jgi:hypothetical protein